MSASESGYRRGVCQGIWGVCRWLEEGATLEDIRVACNESLVMRYDNSPHPIFMDELRARVKSKIEGKRKVKS